MYTRLLFKTKIIPIKLVFEYEDMFVSVFWDTICLDRVTMLSRSIATQKVLPYFLK